MPSHSYQTDDATCRDLGSRETREILHADPWDSGWMLHKEQSQSDTQHITQPMLLLHDKV